MSDDLRGLMFSIAYRMVGSVGDAEDIVQESYLRMEEASAEGVEIESPKAYLSTITTRLAIDHLRSARVRRERYPGPWMPEPVVTDPSENPAEQAEIAESLSIAFLVLLEALSPRERAVFVLREVFDYGYEEIARIVETSEENGRQIAHRARQRIAEGERRFPAPPEEREELSRRFFDAFEAGDVESVLEVLAADVVFVGDGGGSGLGISRPVHGRAAVGRLLSIFIDRASSLGLDLEPATVNGQPGAVVRDPDGRVFNVVALDVAGGEITAVRSIVNPDKLGHLGPVSDVGRR